MNKKLIRLTEQDLHSIVKESVNKILKEAEAVDIDDDRYFGGGLGDNYFKSDEAPEYDGITEQDIVKLNQALDFIYDIANNRDGDIKMLYDAADKIETFIKIETSYKKK